MLQKPNLSELENAIFSTVAYRDMFDFPVTLSEIHRYLHGVKASKSEVEVALRDGGLVADYLETDGTFFCLKGRQNIFEDRIVKDKQSEEHWHSALKLSAWVASAPFVRMVALTGSLCVRNHAKGDDIDVICVTETGKLWRVRALVLLFQRFEYFRSGTKVCPNVFRTEQSLALPIKSLYFAQELTQMVPIFGSDTYDEFRKSNDWTSSFLPNSSGPPDLTPRAPVKTMTGLRRSAEFLSGNRLADRFEVFESRRKIKKFNTQNAGLGKSTQYQKEATALNLGVVEVIENQWRKRINQAALQIPAFPNSDPLFGSSAAHPPEKKWPLQCPKCKTSIDDLNASRTGCPTCSLATESSDFFDFSEIDRSPKLKSGLDTYKTMRTSQGYTGQASVFYRRLPYVPASKSDADIWDMRRRGFESLKQLLKKNMKPGASLLDLGSGNGWMSNRLTQAGYHVLAIDINDDPDDGLAARRHYLQDWVSARAHFNALPLPDQCVSGAIFNGSFHYAEQQIETLREAKRVIQPGGCIFVMDSPIYSTEKAGQKMLDERKHRFASVLPSTFLTKQNMQDMADTLGLELDMHHPNYSSLLPIRKALGRMRGNRETASFAIFSLHVPK